MNLIRIALILAAMPICLCGFAQDADQNSELSDTLTTMAPPVEDQRDLVAGESLFKANCKACHHLEMRLVGPALKGVHERHDEEWMLKFIKSSQSVIASGDSVAIDLFNTYNQVIMPDQPLTEDQILDVLAYVKAGDAPKGSGGITRPVAAVNTSYAEPLKFSDYRFWILYTITVILVIVAVYYKAEIAELAKKAEGVAEEAE